jgi:hypothetical protein
MESKLESLGRAVRAHRADGGGLRLPPELRDQIVAAARQARTAGGRGDLFSRAPGATVFPAEAPELVGARRRTAHLLRRQRRPLFQEHPTPEAEATSSSRAPKTRPSNPDRSAHRTARGSNGTHPEVEATSFSRAPKTSPSDPDPSARRTARPDNAREIRPIEAPRARLFHELPRPPPPPDAPHPCRPAARQPKSFASPRSARPATPAAHSKPQTVPTRQRGNTASPHRSKPPTPHAMRP